jgi:signal transduction histidine kinase
MSARVADTHRPSRRKGAEAFAPASSLLVHDIKNLSFRLGALLQNLQTHYDDPLFKKSVVDVLGDTVDQMDRMVRRCRDRRDGVIIKYPVDLNEVLERIINGIPEEKHSDRGVLIESRLERIPKIWGDPDCLGEAFAIVIENALEAIEGEEGHVNLETRVAKTRSGKRRVIVRISDTGCGMDPEFIRKCLFTPFCTTKNDGLGMGLYACKKIVELHEGSIRVSSQMGRGTTFRISFNAA